MAEKNGSKSTDFAQALEGRGRAREARTGERSGAEGEGQAGKTIHIGGQFEKEVSVALKILAAKESRPVIALLCEGINLVFEARGLPPIAAVTRPAREKRE